jgi:hypothetical protein
MSPRRLAAVSIVTLLGLALIMPAVLASGQEKVEDSFCSASYSGGSGWTGNWEEIGETTNRSSGVVQAVDSGCDNSSCIRFSNTTLLSLSIDKYAIWRRTDISGATGATLTFTYKRSLLAVVEVWTRSGPSDAWSKTTLNGGLSGYATAWVNVAADASATTEIRFHLSSLLPGGSAYFDRVVISATYPSAATSTTSSTTTTTEPIITLPTVTVPPLLTTTTVSASTTTTSGGTGTSTTTTTTAGGTGTSTTTSTAPPGAGGGGSDSPPGGESSGDGDQATVNPPLTEGELDFAAESNIVVNLAGEGDFGGFEPGIGINPMTDLWVKLNTTVEAISTEILSALGLGAMIAFFAVRRISDDDPIAASVEPRS